MDNESWILILFLLLLILIPLIGMSWNKIMIPNIKIRPQPIIGGCSGTQYGCCPDGVTARSNWKGSNCWGIYV